MLPLARARDQSLQTAEASAIAGFSAISAT